MKYPPQKPDTGCYEKYRRPFSVERIIRECIDRALRGERFVPPESSSCQVPETGKPEMKGLSVAQAFLDAEKKRVA